MSWRYKHTNISLDYILYIGYIIIISLISGNGAQNYSSCYVFGTEHVVTFDSQRIDVISSSECRFTLAYTCPASAQVNAKFDISITNAVHGDVSKVDCVQMVYSGYTVKLCANQTATVNGNQVVSLLTPNEELMVYTGSSGLELSIQTAVSPEVVTVTMTRDSMVRVMVPSTYSQKLCGLCGNFDGNADNDLVTSTGSNVSTQSLEIRSANIAGSYLVPSDVMGCQVAADIIPFMASNCSAADPQVTTDILDSDYCGVYDSATFSECSNANQELAAIFMAICEFDFCENYLISESELNEELSSGCLEEGGCSYNATVAKTAVINVAEVFVDVCRTRGTELNTWRTDYAAELSCAGDSKYNFTGPTCPLVCGGRTADRCTEANRDGCECQAGLYRDGDRCIASDACGCQDPLDGSYHSVGDEWLDMTCSTLFTCPSSNDLVQSQVVCSEFATCTNAAGMYSCTCNDNYDGDGFNCLRQCLEGQQPTSDQVMCQECPVGTYQPLANQDACLPCPQSEVTSSTGSTNETDCHPIVLVPDSRFNAESCDTDVYDRSFKNLIPSNVLPDGLPYGLQLYTELFTSTNGLISFGRSVIGVMPKEIEGVKHPVAVPFWSRQDLRGGFPRTKLCRSSYNPIDSDPDRALESQAALSIISVMLNETNLLDGLDFIPVYAYVATWHRSIAFPYFWYSPTNDHPEYITYQAVVVTDGSNTFLMYTYPSGEEYIKLNINNVARLISMGFNTRHSSFSLYLSHTSQITMLSTELTNTNVTGRWLFQVAERGSGNIYADMCLSWYGNFQNVGPINVDIQCPCNMLLAWFDRRYLISFDSTCAYSLTKQNGYHQMCCYDPFSWQLLTHPREAGYPVEYLPIINPSLFASKDRKNFENCCEKSEHCSLFREIMGTPSCDFYLPPIFAFGFGDPHIYTLDGYDYTYNPIGEFWMIKSEGFKLQARMSQFLDTNGELIQATQFQAVAMKSVATDFVSDRIHVELNNNRTDFIVYKNDVSLTPLLDSTVSDNLVTFTGGIITKTNDSINVVFDSGYSFELSIEMSMLVMESLVPPSANGTIQGLLGAFDGDPSNDLEDSNGVVCDPLNCSPQDIHNIFGESWRITEEESIFWYREFGWNTASYTNTSFIPNFLDESAISVDVAAACNDDLRCIYDATVTNSTEIGVSTKEVYEIGIATASELANVPPYVRGPTKINASIGQPIKVSYTFGDGPGDNDTVYLEITKVPADSVRVLFANNTWSMTWTPTDFTEVALSMYAFENSSMEGNGSVSAELNAHFFLSPNCINGVADFNQLAPRGTISELFYKVICECETGWEGESCDIDIDGCEDKPCFNATCYDTPAANETVDGKSYECEQVTCPEGYTLNYTAECYDTDECALPNSPCSYDVCINTPGSYICKCLPGYEKVGDICQDIDECAANLDSCSDLCHNTDGSYFCSCYSGSILLPDNFTCEMTVSSGMLCGGVYNCSYACVSNNNGSEQCSCPRSKMVDPTDNSSCIAFNECANDQDNVCDTSTGAQCEDLVNGYKCTCQTGYIISNSGITCEECPLGKFGDGCLKSCNCASRAKTCSNLGGCVDCHPGWSGDQCLDNINECNNTDICPSNSMCIDTEGSYRCLCDDGYTSVTLTNQTLCENVDECATQRPCSIYADCTDTIGSYTCSCMQGYAGDGFTCTNINECLDGSHDCLKNEYCEDDTPGYGCSCPLGYHGDGRKQGSGCLDDNECQDVANACPTNNSQCENLMGSYKCVCQEFFTGDGDISCVDINECQTGAYNCSSLTNGNVACVNRELGYDCLSVCNPGYDRIEQGQLITCVDTDECLDPTSCPGGHVTCNNNEGSFDCVCDEFYSKNADELCVDINECQTGAYNCSSLTNGNVTCVNRELGYDCLSVCNPGYDRIEQGQLITCVDTDECLDSTSCPGGHVTCFNTEGSFDCVCNEFYEKNVDGICVDINECQTGAYNCSSLTNGNVTCVNRELGYDCLSVCNPGYDRIEQGQLITCVDTDECLDSTSCPGGHVTCFNTEGSFDCVCNEFYEKNVDGICVDINECQTGAYNCSSLTNGNVTCVNRELGYDCLSVCNPGYDRIEQGQLITCVDTDECLDSTSCPGGHVTCFNTEGSFDCVCNEFYEKNVDGICVDINECQTGAYNCSLLINGNVTCVNRELGYDCLSVCNPGYDRIEQGQLITCVDTDECLDPTSCPGGHVTCFNTEASFNCVCDEFYTKNDEGLCEDINECLKPTECIGEGKRCVNIEPGYTCECLVGHLDPNCDRNTDNTFVMVEQTIDFPYNPEWSNNGTEAYLNFSNEFVSAVSSLYNLTGFEGINILSVERSADNSEHTTINYEVVYTEKPDDLEQKTYSSLVSNDYLLRLNGQDYRDVKMLKFDGFIWSCNNITCDNDFSCIQATVDGYPFCECSGQYTGYRCSEFAEVIEDTPADLVVLWISVGIAAGLLIVGLSVCLCYMFVARRRRRPTRRHSVHRFRGPAIFNPSSRLPVEAFNYQFPARSINSDSVSSTSSLPETGGPSGRVGSVMNFAPRWPKAYYSQLDNVDSH